ncbi:MAG: 4Fe-4S binding protein [Bacillota bacterium]
MKKKQQGGPVAVIECWENIPCNPCEQSCPHGAIQVGWPITNLPRLEESLCRGCGQCIAQCPGQAIFLVDKSYKEELAVVAFPYEYLPLPEAGAVVTAVNRFGEELSSAKVLRVDNRRSFKATPVIYLEVPKQFADEVRSLR